MPENLDLFFQDDLIAVDVVDGDSTLRGIYSAPGELIGNGSVVSDEHSVLMKTSDVSTWPEGKEITVDGEDFYVRIVVPEDDGKFSRVSLNKA